MIKETKKPDFKEERKTQNKKNRSNFTKMLLKQKQARNILFNNLTKEDLLELSLTNKKIKRMVELYTKTPKNQENATQGTLTFESHISKLISKSKKKPKGNVLKTTIFNIDFAKMIAPHNWMLLNPTEELNKEIVTELSNLIPPRLIKDFSKFVYYSSDLKKYILVNRTIADYRQQIFYKLNQRSKDKEESFKDEEKEDMVKLTESKEFSIENFIGTKNGMMMRQRLLHEKLEEMRLERQNKIEILEKNALKFCFSARKISIVLCAGGYFTLVLMDKEKEILHKSDHRYVIRKKQGGRQIIKDKSKNVMTSVGSQMRRLNEVNHQNKIFEILDENKGFLEECDFALIQAPGENRGILFDEERALFGFKGYDNFRNLNIEAKRANYTEAKRLFDEVTKVYFISEEDYVL